MSLRVWLPFTDGTLKQQGLSSEIATSGGTINLTNVGKLGKCVTFGSAAGGITIPASTMTSFTNCSVAFWLKINGWGSSYDTYFQAGTGSTPWNNYIFGFLRNNTNSTICFTISNGNSASNANYLTSALSTNTWYHIVFTYETGKCKIYLNGVLDHEYSTTIVPAFNKITKITLGRCNNDSSYQSQCSINDFRIYDHCLSLMEVKELSKGLVLHYPLNRGGWGQENLLHGSNVIGSGSTIYGWVSNGSATNMELLSDGSLHYKYNISNSKYIPSITTNTVAPCEFGKTYFYSMDLKFDKPINLGPSVPAHFWAGARNSDSITNTSCNGNLSGVQIQYINNHSGTLAANTWAHITTKFTFPAAATSSGYNYPAIRCFIYGAVLTETTTGEVNVWMKNCKIEEGNIETPWCPHVEDALATVMGLNSTIEYDCSGYCNNGTKTGTFEWTSDTPKYSVSTHIGTTSSKIHITGLTTSGFGNSYSFAWWGKRNSNSPMFWGFENGIRLNGMYQGNLWNTGDGSENPIYKPGTTTTITVPTLNVWHHYVMTGDGTACKLYLDGELYGQAKTYKAISGTSLWINGWNSATSYASNNTSMSDFRIYATALSADDVKSLYQNSAYIDSSGNVYGAVHEES